MEAKKYLKQLVFLGAIILISNPSYGLCVKSKTANLRNGPGTNFEISWQTFQNMPLKEISRKGSWVKVRDFENDTHWIHKSLVTKNFKCAVVKQKTANLRTGPGSSFQQDKIFPNAEQYTTFKFVKTKGKWAKVKNSFDDPYWVFRKLVWIN